MTAKEARKLSENSKSSLAVRKILDGHIKREAKLGNFYTRVELVKPFHNINNVVESLKKDGYKVKCKLFDDPRDNETVYIYEIK